jgi:hypothetical protein
MAMKDLALTAKEAKAEYGDCAPCTAGSDADDGPRYPWGLSICLDTGTLEKLGIGLMPVGTELTIMAKATVTGTSSRERIKGDKHEDMDLQLTAMDLFQTVTADDRTAKAASKLYPET